MRCSTTRIDMTSLLHGTAGLLSGYAVVQGGLLAALIRGRAGLRRLLLSPLLAVPVTAAAGVGLAAAAGVASHFGFVAGGVMQLCAGVACSAGLGYGVGRAFARRSALTVTHGRGAIVIDEPAAADAIDGRARRAGRGRGHRAPGITLAGLAVAAEDETKHFKLIGGYLRHFYDADRGDMILNPFDPRSAKWDLFGEVTDDYDVEQLARSLIPDHEGSDRSWRGYARTFFSAVTAQAHAAGSREVSELYRLLVVAGTSEVKTLVAGTPAQPFLEEHNGRMFDSIRSVTSSAVGALEYVSRQRSAPLSVRAWVRGARASPDTPRGKGDPGGVLFLPYRAGQIVALRSIVSAWMRLAIFEAMNREEEQRLWFVVDELDALGQIDGLKDALARLRKFGGRCVLGFQSIAQVSSTYGSGEAQTIVENCGNTLILRCSGSEHGGTSQFASRLIGEREVTRVTSSRSRRPTEFFASITQTEHTGVEAAVMGSEIEQLPDLRGYLKLASSPGWQRVRLRAPVQQLPAEPPSRTARILRFRPASASELRAVSPARQPHTTARDDFGME